jgi:hypothetical protein
MIFTDAAAEWVDEVEQQLSYCLKLISDCHHEKSHPSGFESQKHSCDFSGMIGSGLSLNFELIFELNPQQSTP